MPKPHERGKTWDGPGFPHGEFFESDMLNYQQPDARGHFGPYGGTFVSETLIHALNELADAQLSRATVTSQRSVEQELQQFATSGVGDHVEDVGHATRLVSPGREYHDSRSAGR